MSFSQELIVWYQANKRELPWRETKDPYHIWLSEVILQQTRVDQGLPYYRRFVERFPNVVDLAQAEEDEVLRLWQGLGYYSRARNMHHTARLVVERFQGNFPSSYKDLIQLKGIGPYTAAAVASFAAEEIRAVVDGNVSRVLARQFGVKEPINSTLGKRLFQELADSLIHPDQPGTFNQAIMEFGALHCTPKKPACETCVFRVRCVALKEGLVETLPLKLKHRGRRTRYFHYFLVRDSENRILMRKRGEGDIWANLFELPMIEFDEPFQPLENSDFLENLVRLFGDIQQIRNLEGPVKHVLSHQTIFAYFYEIDVSAPKKIIEKSEWNFFNTKDLNNLAKPKLIFSFLDKYLGVS